LVAAGALRGDRGWHLHLGRQEVYVAPFPDVGRRVPISSGGGAWPRWRRDGKELYYLTANQLVAVAVDGSSPSFKTGSLTPLFDLERWDARWQYDVTADGQRFLVGVQDRPSTPTATLLLHWIETLK
jgi:eukaryotic-like serine/threonine-protein kinase